VTVNLHNVCTRAEVVDNIVGSVAFRAMGRLCCHITSDATAPELVSRVVRDRAARHVLDLPLKFSLCVVVGQAVQLYVGVG
jgi:hypothetical protein